MTRNAVIVDFGVGNILSVSRALEYAGATVSLASTAAQVEAADYLVLPGVGAFHNGMTGLRNNGLADAVKHHAASGRPLLGICLGAQMLASVSNEFGRHEGLNLIPGEVAAIPATNSDGKPHKLPSIGWALMKESRVGSFHDSPLRKLPGEASVYLVHSFHVLPDDPNHVIGQYSYGGLPITAAIRAGNIFGFQFHPEKSGPLGLRIIGDFLSL